MANDRTKAVGTYSGGQVRMKAIQTAPGDGSLVAHMRKDGNKGRLGVIFGVLARKQGFFV